MEGIIRMFNGRMVDVFNLRPEDVVPINFIHSLACINRYTGSAPFPISVMRHSITLMQWCSQNTDVVITQERIMDVPADDQMHWTSRQSNLSKAAYLHDWSEALFNDLATPVKRNMPNYKLHEEAAQQVIFDVFEVPIVYLDILHKWDKAIYLDEVRATWGFVPDDFTEETGCRPLGVSFRDRSWKEDRLDGLNEFKRLFPDTWCGAVLL